MEVIDFDKKGNVVRLSLGEKTEDWGWTRPDYVWCGEHPDWLKPSDRYYGDDWNDTPYECNAGSVYGEFVKGYIDLAFDFDSLVLEPSDGEFNSSYCKDDMEARNVPCLIIVPKSVYRDSWDTDSFKTWVGSDKILKIYFGDDIEETIGKAKELGILINDPKVTEVEPEPIKEKK